MKFHENPSSGNRAVLSRWTDVRNLIVVFRNFAYVLKNDTLYPHMGNVVFFMNLRTDSDCLTECVYCAVRTEF